jgi:tetratricopeptide (TPR) repeat protein
MSAIPLLTTVGPENPIDWASKNYLIVDDFAGVRQLLRESLRSLGAKTIDQAMSGGEAMALLARTRYDVVLCDYYLGEGKNGQQVLEEARVRHLINPSTMWIMVSAEKGVESVVGAAEHQPDAYLLKPITEGVLLTRLNRVWHKKQVFSAIDQAYAEKDYLRAARLCDEQIATHKVHEIELLRMKARLMEKSGQPDKARAAYEQVLAQREYQWARTGLAKVRMAGGEFEQARQLFHGVIAENRWYIDAYDQLAQAYEAMGQFDEACAILERAAKLSPNSVTRQRDLGKMSLKLGNTALAEKAFRKCIAVGEYSIRKTPDAYLGLARVCGMKNDTKEALALLLQVLRDFAVDHPDIQLRAKVTEGLVYHESGDYRRARKAGDDIEQLLRDSGERPDTATCMEMAALLFAVGVRDAPVELLSYVIRNNHDQAVLLDEVRKLFDKARMAEEGEAIIRASRKEAADLMNQGVLLWKTGKLREAVEWMRNARAAVPNNLRILFNAAQVLLSHLQKFGYDETLAQEAQVVLQHVDKLQPGQPRFAQMMEQLAALAPQVEEAGEAQTAEERLSDTQAAAA